MATGIYSWSQTAATNATADANINWAEGQSSASVNDSARSMMAVLSKWRDDISGVTTGNSILTTGGSANAQTLTTNGSIAALTNGWTVTFKAGASNTGATTLNVDSLGAKSVYRISGTAITGGEILAGAVYTVTYHQPVDAWVLQGGSSAGMFPSGTLMLFQQTSAPTGWTKQTTHNDKALRVVSGTASSGGSTAFTTVFASRTITTSNLPSHTHGPGTLGGVTNTTGAHTHTISNSGNSVNNLNGGGANDVAGLSSDTTSSNGDHSHTITLSTGISDPTGSGTAMDFAVQYVDLIIASKD